MFLVAGSWLGRGEGMERAGYGFRSSSKGAGTLRISGPRFSTSVSGYGIRRNGSRHSFTGEGGLRQLPETHPLGRCMPATALGCPSDGSGTFDAALITREPSAFALSSSALASIPDPAIQ